MFEELLPHNETQPEGKGHLTLNPAPQSKQQARRKFVKKPLFIPAVNSTKNSEPEQEQEPETPVADMRYEPVTTFKTIGLQAHVFSLEYKSIDVKASDEVLNKIYDGSVLGLKGESLAYFAGLKPKELVQLEQLDDRIGLAKIAGKADQERELSSILMAASRGGDAKTAMEVLKCKHGWVSATVVKNEHTGANGGPIELSAVDLRSFSDDEIETMERLLTKASVSTDVDVTPTTQQ